MEAKRCLFVETDQPSGDDLFGLLKAIDEERVDGVAVLGHLARILIDGFTSMSKMLDFARVQSGHADAGQSQKD